MKVLVKGSLEIMAVGCVIGSAVLARVAYEIGKRVYGEEKLNAIISEAILGPDLQDYNGS